MGPQFFRFHAKDRPIQSPFMTGKGMQRIYSNLGPHEVNCFEKYQSIDTEIETREESQKYIFYIMYIMLHPMS
jgi:hypothetical protein